MRRGIFFLIGLVVIWFAVAVGGSSTSETPKPVAAAPAPPAPITPEQRRTEPVFDLTAAQRMCGNVDGLPMRNEDGRKRYFACSHQLSACLEAYELQKIREDAAEGIAINGAAHECDWLATRLVLRSIAVQTAELTYDHLMGRPYRKASEPLDRSQKEFSDEMMQWVAKHPNWQNE